MKYFLVAVRDRAAETFQPPMCIPHVGIARRSFETEVNRADEKNPLFTHPEDFELYQVGTYDDSSGVITPGGSPEMMCTGKEVRRSVN